jgi:hypothetical protein
MIFNPTPDYWPPPQGLLQNANTQGMQYMIAKRRREGKRDF